MKTILLPQSAVYAGNLILVNAQYPFRENAEPHVLVPACTAAAQQLLEQRAANALAALMNALDGWRGIEAVSGWRTGLMQKEIYESSLQTNGGAFTEKYVALPDHSEHQTGLAIDLAEKQATIDFLCPSFPYHGLCQRFRENSPRFGFVERYRAGKEAATGIAHEPWHFRYVGTPHAAIMTRLDMALEEYHAFLKGCPYGEKRFVYQTEQQCFAVSYIPAAKNANTEVEVDAGAARSISGNNMDGFILTEWRQNGAKRQADRGA